MKGFTANTKKVLLIAIVFVIFFGGQMAVIFYVKNTLNNSLKKALGSSDITIVGAQIDQQNLRLQALQTDFNYIKSYIIANRINNTNK